jgi:pimeloyl-ACP methyl ester carboxylesterase
MKYTILLIWIALMSIHLSAQDIISTDKLPEVVIKGNGDNNLLLIPCMGCRWNEWEEFMDRNSKKYTMYAITVPGYGGTTSLSLPMNTVGTPYRDYLLSGLSELINDYNLSELTVVGHSWGVMVAVQLAAKRQDVVKRVISVDGTIMGANVEPDNLEERQRKANKIIADWGPKLQSAEEWSKFNGANVGLALGKLDSVSTETMLTKIKLLTSFMATDRTTMLQYWRENMLIDLELEKVAIPILDIQSFTGKNQEEKKKQYLVKLEKFNDAKNVTPVFMYDTKHFIMFHRPLKLDCLIDDFILGKQLKDYAPITSEYYDEETMN